MFKVLIWDFTGTSAQWIDLNIDKKDVEIVATITPNVPPSEILLKRDAWDWLLIFENGSREFFDVTVQILGLPVDRVIYALDIESWLQHPKAAFVLIDPTSEGRAIHNGLHFDISQQLNDFITCTVEGFSYIATAKDRELMRVMYVNRVNHAADSIKLFHTLSKKYYGVDDSAGYFLDLGANIGTTGIYFTKKLAPNLKLLAFEPDAENFKLLRINLLLNEIGDDKATIVNCGLGDKFDELTMYRDLTNPGHNNFTDIKDDVPTEIAKIMPLDSYLAEHKIAAHEVKYIWIDTEGFEAPILLGAKNLLMENPAPIFMEFNPMIWNKSGYFDQMINLLKTVGYTHCVFTAEPNQAEYGNIHSIDELWQFKNSKNVIGSLGDVFLIKAGSIN